MTEKKGEQLKADLRKLANKYNFQDIIVIYSYPIPPDNEIFSLGAASIIYENSVFYKQLTAVRGQLITEKFWENL